MTDDSGESDWREGRRKEARRRILASAWALVGEQGLAALSLRQLAGRVGISTPTVYSYFPSKNAIFDAMFREAADDFLDCLTAPRDPDDPEQALLVDGGRFVDFCLADVPRYQLLFQQTIPDFEPSAENERPKEEALGVVRSGLHMAGITAPRHVDMWTAITTGLVDQQISNDPNGNRWSALLPEAADMFMSYCRRESARS